MERQNDFALQLAEAQFMGFIEASRGYSIIQLVISMGLDKQEWQRIRFFSLFEYNQELRNEVDEYFNIK